MKAWKVPFCVPKGEMTSQGHMIPELSLQESFSHFSHGLPKEYEMNQYLLNAQVLSISHACLHKEK